MQSNPERADVVQEQIRQAVTMLVAQGHTLTKRAVAEAAGCSPTTVMKYRAIWQASETPDETLPADDPLALTPENLSAWQELEARFAPLSIAARLWGCGIEKVTPLWAAYWFCQYHRLRCIGQAHEELKLTYKVLRPYKDRLALLEEAVETRYSNRDYVMACRQVKTLGIRGLPLPANRRFLDLPYPTLAWEYLVAARVPIAEPEEFEVSHGQNM